MLSIWLICFIGLLILEFITTDLVCIWFAGGALAALIAAVFIDSWVIQSIIFIVVSLILLLVTRPLVKKFKINKFEPTNADMVIGKVAEVTKEITADSYGEVKVFGDTWLAACDKKIGVGEKVIINKIEGAKLIVRKKGEE